MIANTPYTKTLAQFIANWARDYGVTFVVKINL